MANKGINKVILIGNLGQDPEIRHIPNGGVITKLSLATSESWRDKQTSEIKEKTEWHRVILFGRLAEVAGDYLRKGSQVYIEGSIQTRKWSDQNGQDHYITEIIVNINGNMKMLGGRQMINTSNSDQNNWISKNQENNTQLSNSVTPIQHSSSNMISRDDNESSTDFDDDIPF